MSRGPGFVADHDDLSAYCMSSNACIFAGMNLDMYVTRPRIRCVITLIFRCRHVLECLHFCRIAEFTPCHYHHVSQVRKLWVTEVALSLLKRSPICTSFFAAFANRSSCCSIVDPHTMMSSMYTTDAIDVLETLVL